MKFSESSNQGVGKRSQTSDDQTRRKEAEQLEFDHPLSITGFRQWIMSFRREVTSQLETTRLSHQMDLGNREGQDSGCTVGVYTNHKCGKFRLCDIEFQDRSRTNSNHQWRLSKSALDREDEAKEQHSQVLTGRQIG